MSDIRNLAEAPEPLFVEKISQPTHAVGLDGTLVAMLKAKLAVQKGSQRWDIGMKEQPINFEAAKQTMLSVNIQQTCIATKRDAIVGLGFVTEEEKENKKLMQDLAAEMAKPAQPGQPSKPAGSAVTKLRKAIESSAEGSTTSKVCEKLDPLCEDGFQELLDQVGEDYANTGNGYIEVVRDGTEIVALWHMPAENVRVWLEADKPNYHYVCTDNASTLKYAKPRDADALRARTKSEQKQITELLHFRMPSAFSPWYGVPDWLAVTPFLELAQIMVQYNFDFFQNRAVPELLAFFLGRRLPDAQFNNFCDMLKGTSGAGNRHKSIAMNIPDPEMTVQIEKLTGETREKFGDIWSTVEANIVSGHRVPPLLAGIQTPGKLGAANELPNALMAFQILYVDRHQKVFRDKLRKFFVEEGFDLQDTDFTFRRIIDYFDMGSMDTISRMRETVTEAQASGRKVSDGLQD